MLLNKTIRLFLDHIGRREEYEFYLNKFQSAGTVCFALLVPDLESLDQGAEAFAFDLHFLIKLGLRPAVALCGNNAEAQWARLENHSLFERSTFPLSRDMECQIPVFIEKNIQGLEKMIPMTESEREGQRLVARRVHFVRATGGLKVDYFYIQKPVSPLCPEDQTLVSAATSLLIARPGIHISVTSPINLLKEIFTVKGAGTVFRRGHAIISDTAPHSIRLLALLGESFGKTPKKGVLSAATKIFFDENYRAAALLETHSEGFYLSKFAVGPEARGEGLAQELWDEVCKNYTAFFWRSRIGNPINQWYDRHADGRCIASNWMVFWRGMEINSIPALITFCQRRPSDFA